MKNYSRQLDRFIESKPFANSFFRPTDNRTWVSYYIDAQGMVHSSSFNYSVMHGNPITIDEFKKCAEKDAGTTVTYK